MNPVRQPVTFFGGKLHGQLLFKKQTEILKKAINLCTRLNMPTNVEIRKRERERKRIFGDLSDHGNLKSFYSDPARRNVEIFLLK